MSNGAWLMVLGAKLLKNNNMAEIKKITIEDIRIAYASTHFYSNGCNLDEVFSKGYSMGGSYWGGKFDLVHYLIENLVRAIPDTKFKSIVLHSDGGIRSFMILYQLSKDHNYNTIVTIYSGGSFGNDALNETDSIHKFAGWLNKHQERIEYLTHQPL